MSQRNRNGIYLGKKNLQEDFNKIIIRKPVSDLEKNNNNNNDDDERLLQRERESSYCFGWFLDNAYCCRWNAAEEDVDGIWWGGDGERPGKNNWWSSVLVVGRVDEICRGAVWTMPGEYCWDDDEEDDEEKFEMRFCVVDFVKGKCSLGNIGDNGSSNDEAIRSHE